MIWVELDSDHISSSLSDGTMVRETHLKIVTQVIQRRLVFNKVGVYFLLKRDKKMNIVILRPCYVHEMQLQ